MLIPFFGRPAPFPLGPFILARAAGVPVVPAFCMLDADGRYTRARGRPSRSSAAARRRRRAPGWACSRSVVRENPTQWFNFFDVWDPFGL